jgi:hypothetical protein
LAGDYLTLPSPANLFRINRRYFWLERGVKERGGEAPSRILSHYQNRASKRGEAPLFLYFPLPLILIKEGGLRGMDFWDEGGGLENNQNKNVFPQVANSAPMPYS